MSRFHVIEQTIRRHDTRDRSAGAEIGYGNEPSRLRVKKYLPKTNSHARPGDVTILAVDADGFPDELYDSLWDDLLEQMQARKRRLRSIWIVDVADQGQGGDDEGIYGAEENEQDHDRDLLLMVNQLRDQMPGPLIAIGHGAGAAHLVRLSLVHPRLLDGLVLVEPIFSQDLRVHDRTTRAPALRCDIWPCRPIATEEFGVIRLCQRCDEHLLSPQIGYALSDLPIEQHSEASVLGESPESPVILTATKPEDDFSYFRVNPGEPRLLQDDEFQLDECHSDMKDCGSERQEAQRLQRNLSELRPSVMYMFGAQSPMSASEVCAEMINATGTGIGGSGGVAKGRVKATLIDAGHLLPIDEPKQCAEEIVHFIDAELDRWATEQRQNTKAWTGLTRPQRLEVGDLWLRSIGIDRERERSKSTTRTSKL